MVYLTRIWLYPIKSLDGVEVEQAKILAGGALQFDRQFAIVDEKGKFINGKRNPKVHLLRTSYNLDALTVTIHCQGEPQSQTFHLQKESAELATWFSNYFGQQVTLTENLDLGFPDDTEASGPTVISTGTLKVVSEWFPGLSVDDTRWRFRANLELAGVPPFWEEQLYGEPEAVVKFQIGEVQIAGVNPCQRCVVPTRDPRTGEAYPDFQKIFVRRRQETLPQWATRSRFNHYFRLSVNTKISPSEAGKQLKVGDRVTILGQNS